MDDDRTMRRLLRRALENDGYRVLEAGDGVEALQIFRESGPDIVLMDAAMPGMDGFQACKALRRISDGGQIPVLMITGLDDDASMEAAFAAGATDYITKPVNWTILRQRVRRMIQERRAEKRVNYLAYHDELTGLPNRTLFMERLEASLQVAQDNDELVGLLFLDLDGFKLVNDTMGHVFGDLLLKTVAERLVGCLRGEDMVARLGGDEFTVILGGVTNTRQVTAAAQRLLDSLSHPVIIQEREIFVGASIGIALFPGDGEDAGTLLKNADTAMYRAKDAGRNTFEYYTDAMGAQVQVRMSLESSIRRALEHRQFTLYYQPIVDFTSGRLVTQEALLRWQHPELGIVSPLDFIPLAEETGLINPLGQWVMQEAFTLARDWQTMTEDPVRVAVNLSARQFNDAALVQHIRNALHDAELPPDLLEVEITENTVMQNTERSIEMLRELKDLGVHVAVDDFGTGYSSLGYLKRLPLDRLKVDRSFVRNIPNDSDDCAIVQAIVALAHSLRLKVVAEGVETIQQCNHLRDLGCDFAQGYLVGRPAPSEDSSSIVASGLSLLPGPSLVDSGALRDTG